MLSPINPRSIAAGTFAIAFNLFIFCAPAARAQGEPSEAPKLADDLHETIAKVPATVTLFSGKNYTGQMTVTHFRPDGDGPFPVVIMNHGRAGALKEKRAMPLRQRYTSVARYWIRRGFAVFVPTRLGYGETGVDADPEYSGSACDDRNFGVPLTAMLKQTSVVLEFAQTLPWADTKRVIIMGQSYGGFSAIGASAEKWPGVLATIDFAGGAGGRPDTNPGDPCSPDKTMAIVAELGKRATLPMLWLYSENDRYWGAKWPRQWHAAYVKAGGRAEMTTFPPVGNDGHTLLGGGFRLWRPVVDRFVEKLGFPPPRSKDAPKPTEFARIDQAEKLPFVKDAVKTDGYQKFLDTDIPRAFVVSTTGGWASRSGDNAAGRALEWCKANSKGSCHLYAVDDAVVFKPPVSAAATAAP